MTLETLQQEWQDTPEHHIHTNDLFKSLMEQDPELNEHRTWVRNHVFGMGEDSFHWFWKLLVDEMPSRFKFCEVGVHKAQIVSLIRILSNRLNKDAVIIGITPMNGSGTGWKEDDYEGDIKKIHDNFSLQQPVLFKGYSQDKNILEEVSLGSPFDCVYLDGSHEYKDILDDLKNYGGMVKPGGYLVIDDANCDLNFPPSGYFTGIKEVMEAKQAYIAEKGDMWEWMFNVVHLGVYRRK